MVIDGFVFKGLGVQQYFKPMCLVGFIPMHGSWVDVFDSQPKTHNQNAKKGYEKGGGELLPKRHSLIFWGSLLSVNLNF